MHVTRLSFYKSLLPCQIDMCIGKTVLFCISFINQHHRTIPSIGSLLSLKLGNIKKEAVIRKFKNFLRNSVCLFERVRERERDWAREKMSFIQMLWVMRQKAQQCLEEKYKDRVLLCSLVQVFILWPLRGRLSLMLPQVLLNSLVHPKMHVLEKKNMTRVGQRRWQMDDFQWKTY